MSDENRKTILLVEDEAVVLAVTSKIVEKFGYNVVTADSGVKAVETALSTKKINLILMDADLGKGLNGPEAVQQILAKRNIPVVFLTSHSEKEMVEKIHGITRYGYVIKNSGDFVLQSSIEMALELFESNENLRIQHDLSLTLNASTDLYMGLDNLLKTVLRLESIDSGGVYLADPVSGALDLAVHYGLSQEFVEHVLYFTPDSSSVRLVSTGKANYGSYGDIRPVTDKIREKEGLRSIAIIPIMNQEKLIAVLNLASHTHDFIPAGTRITLEMLALQIGSILMRLRTETLLRENEELYRTIFENTGSAMLLIEEDMTMSMVNSEFIRRSGYSRDEIIGKMKWTELVHPDDLGRMVEQHRLRRQSHEKNVLPSYEFRFITKSGEIRNTLLTIELIQGTKKSIASLIDITESKKAEEELKIAEETYRNMFLNAQIGLFRTDINTGLVIEANDCLARFAGYKDRSDLLSDSFNMAKSYVNSNDRENMISILKKYGQFNNLEIQFKRKDGSIIWIRYSGKIVPEKGWIEGVSEDITEHKLAEKEKDSLKEQLLQTQKLESLGRLAGGIAHDFNNLLTGIIGFSELAALKLPEGHSALEDINMILNAGNKAADLVKQLLAFGRKNKLEFSMIDLNESVKNTTKMLSRLIGENISLENKTSLNMKKISADPTQLSQILINLVINARDAMPDGGKITIETSMAELDEKYVRIYEDLSPGEYALLSVSDTGTGMTKEIQKEIFDPFFTTKEKGKGTGLGLSTVFGIVKQHKGHILVNSESDKGSTFKIYLPCLENPEIQNDSVEIVKDLRGSESILVVDDDATPQKVVVDTLKSLGYTIYEASSGEEALKLFEDISFRVDLVISDIVMSGMNGKYLADRLTEIRPGIKIILMSGYSNIGGGTDKKIGYDFIQKPFTPNFIMNHVRKVLNKKP